MTATGHFRHDQEMLVGPRMNEGEDGYLVITPLERPGEGTTILVNRGWIPKKLKDQRARLAAARPGPDSAGDPFPRGLVTVEGLLREPWKKNMFTPVNRPDKGEWYFPDVLEMARWTGSQPVWIEETMGMLGTSRSRHASLTTRRRAEPSRILRAHGTGSSHRPSTGSGAQQQSPSIRVHMVRTLTTDRPKSKSLTMHL